MAGPVYLADTSVYVMQGRHSSVRRRFESTTPPTALALSISSPCYRSDEPA
jgi:hypothetical protein